MPSKRIGLWRKKGGKRSRRVKKKKDLVRRERTVGTVPGEKGSTYCQPLVVAKGEGGPPGRSILDGNSLRWSQQGVGARRIFTKANLVRVLLARGGKEGAEQFKKRGRNGV